MEKVSHAWPVNFAPNDARFIQRRNEGVTMFDAAFPYGRVVFWYADDVLFLESVSGDGRKLEPEILKIAANVGAKRIRCETRIRGMARILSRYGFEPLAIVAERKV